MYLNGRALFQSRGTVLSTVCRLCSAEDTEAQQCLRITTMSWDRDMGQSRHHIQHGQDVTCLKGLIGVLSISSHPLK